jgi:hypothetical protein
MINEVVDNASDDRARNFVMFFEEKEGTTAIVRLMDNFPQVDVLRARGEWEPFDRHACGPMPTSSLRECLDLIFSGGPAAEVNRIYRRTATRSLTEFRSNPSVGFKMRFKPPRDRSGRPEAPDFPQLGTGTDHESRARFARTMIDVLKRHDVLVFLAVRQNLLRWALSKYHGDGTGRPGHIQFRLATGKVARHEISRIHVDPDVLERKIDVCRAIHAGKRRLAAGLRDAGLDVVPVRYEDFLGDQLAFLGELLAHLGQRPSDAELRDAVARGPRIERVHGDDLSEFFLNASELEARFGDRFERWPDPL